MCANNTPFKAQLKKAEVCDRGLRKINSRSSILHKQMLLLMFRTDARLKTMYIVPNELCKVISPFLSTFTALLLVMRHVR